MSPPFEGLAQRQLLHQPEAVLVGQPDVGDDHVRRPSRRHRSVERRERFAADRASRTDDAHLLQRGGENFQRVFPVLDEQHAEAPRAPKRSRSIAGFERRFRASPAGEMGTDGYGVPTPTVLSAATVSTVQLDQLPDERKPEPQAAVAAIGRRVLLAEALEHLGQEVGRNTQAGVADLQLERSSGSRRATP